ncbi:hypothetical protein MCUN1_000226 [Malassezia cuniculi]|uniref:Secondary thiamine-phosphate synthase enzyme n=1 Tax=Malassezia cuniculi TaxID=948313 RepID=A0AAF0EVI9_9BASI|nr:hypothetical protein MCUN1_000226 [Malassezia cuniculi]
MQPPQHPEAAAARAAAGSRKAAGGAGDATATATASTAPSDPPTLYSASPHYELDAKMRKVRERLKERRRVRGDGHPLFWGTARRIQDPTLIMTLILTLGILFVFVPVPTILSWFTRRPAPPPQHQPTCGAFVPCPPRMPTQKTITLSARTKGCHLIQAEVESELRDMIRDVKAGIVHLFIQHTSAALSLNENFDPDVRRDMDMALDHAVPESLPWRHTDEGPDDSVSHTKASLIGPSITLPITDGRLALGTWQGIYLCEFRKQRHTRRLIATVLP